jgi:small subunit ribosomal protein S18
MKEKIDKKPLAQRSSFWRKGCFLCASGQFYINHKDIDLLKPYINRHNKISPQRETHLCKKHQNMVANAIKKARIIGLLPFVDDK